MATKRTTLKSLRKLLHGPVKISGRGVAQWGTQENIFMLDSRGKGDIAAIATAHVPSNSKTTAGNALKSNH